MVIWILLCSAEVMASYTDWRLVLSLILVAFPYSSLSSLVASEICFLGGIIRDTIEVPDLLATKTKINKISPLESYVAKRFKNVDATLSRIILRLFFKSMVPKGISLFSSLAQTLYLFLPPSESEFSHELLDLEVLDVSLTLILLFHDCAIYLS